VRLHSLLSICLFLLMTFCCLFWRINPLFYSLVRKCLQRVVVVVVKLGINLYLSWTYACIYYADDLHRALWSEVRCLSVRPSVCRVPLSAAIGCTRTTGNSRDARWNWKRIQWNKWVKYSLHSTGVYRIHAFNKAILRQLLCADRSMFLLCHFTSSTKKHRQVGA